MSILNGNEPVVDSRSLDERIWSLAADDQWHRRSEALILLHKAQSQLKVSEQRICEQEKRIHELEGLASTDPLTGLFNRRGFEKFFSQEEDRARRYNSFGSVLILFDLDNLKQINDTYGHQAGDACLRKVAEYLRGKIRSVDAAARIGGDEFAVLLSNTDLEKSAECIDGIKRAMTGLPVTWQETTLHISASIGMKHVSDNISYETAYRAADEVLYKEKKRKKLAHTGAYHEDTVDDKGNYKIKNLSVNKPSGDGSGMPAQYVTTMPEMMLSML